MVWHWVLGAFRLLTTYFYPRTIPRTYPYNRRKLYVVLGIPDTRLVSRVGNDPTALAL